MGKMNQQRIATVIGLSLVGLIGIVPTYASAHEKTGNWIVNNDGERSKHMLVEADGEGVLVNVQSISTETIDNTDYVRIKASGIPNYRVTVDQPLLDLLLARPKSQDDFINGTPDISIGDVVEYGQDIGFKSSTENCESTGGSGYWPPGPGCPTNVSKSSLITSAPVVSNEECKTGLGAIGYFSNGTSIYDWNDGQSFNGEQVWQNTAANAEIHDLDICLGHAARGDYHHHNYSSCMAEQLGDTGDSHSPAYGQAADGYPVHGPWHSAETLVVSSWNTRDYDSADSTTGCGGAGERTCLLVDQYDLSKGTESASSNGPTTSEYITSLSRNPIPAVSGLYFQDYYFDASAAALGGAYLDKHNGHEHDNIGYHYHLTIEKNASGLFIPTFPFTFGPTYKGVLDEHSLSSCGSNRAGGRGLPPRLEEAARQLNVSPEALMNALGGPGQRPDFADAASKLGVSEDALRAALPAPPKR